MNLLKSQNLSFLLGYQEYLEQKVFSELLQQQKTDRGFHFTTLCLPVNFL